MIKITTSFTITVILLLSLVVVTISASSEETQLESEVEESTTTSFPKPLRILGISGSLRKASVNTGLLRYIKSYLKENPSSFPNVQFKIANISRLPIYNQDNDMGQGGGKTSLKDVNKHVKKFRELVDESDAFIFAVTEHNYGVSAAMKNALDWASRGFPKGNVWRGKIAGMIGCGGQSGAGRAMLAMRQIGAFLDLHFVNAPDVAINRFGPENKDIFDEKTGDLMSETRQQQVMGMFERTVVLARKLMD